MLIFLLLLFYNLNLSVDLQLTASIISIYISRIAEYSILNYTLIANCARPIVELRSSHSVVPHNIYYLKINFAREVFYNVLVVQIIHKNYYECSYKNYFQMFLYSHALNMAYNRYFTPISCLYNFDLLLRHQTIFAYFRYFFSL